MTELNTAAAPAASEQTNTPNSGEPPAPAANTEATATSPADTAANTPDEGEAQQGNKPPRGVQKRIDELTREKRELQRLYHELATTQRRGDPPATGRGQPVAEAEPKSTDFNSYDDYLKAQRAYDRKTLLAEAEKTVRENMRKAAETQARERKDRAFTEAATKAAERYEDFDDVVFRNDGSLSITPYMADVIKESEKGPDLAYWLGSHPDDAARISGLSPLAQARELGRIEATLNPPSPKKTSSAPDPVKTVAGKDTATKDPDKMSDDEWLKWRNKGLGRG